MTEGEYRALTRPHTRAIRQLLTELDFFIEDVGPINLFSTTSRIKTVQSAVEKARKLRIPVDQLQDLAAIRIVLAVERDVDVIARFFYREQDSKNLIIESDEPLSRDNGYRARHIVAVARPRYTSSMHSARFEVQLLTVLQHAFNFMSRAWIYKSDSCLSREWKSRFTELGATLREQDKIANMLHSEVVEAASTLADSAHLSPMSYQRLVRNSFGEDISLDDAVDSCRMMVDVGARTNGDVRSFFEDDRIEQLRQSFSTSEADAAKSLREIVEGWSKHVFWLIYGLRFETTCKWFSEGTSSAKPKDVLESGASDLPQA